MPLGAIKVSAAGEQPYVAQVGNQKYANYRDAWAAVKNGGELTMLADWHTAEMLTVEADRYVTVHMNGHMINRGLTKSEDDGEIFLVKKNGLLILNGNGINSTEHWGTVRNGKWTFRENGMGTVKINGSLLTGGYNDDGGAAIHIQDNAEVRLDGVTVAGNATSDNDMGGAIRLQGDDSVLRLINSTISYNRSDDGGGAAIWVEGDDSFVEINNSKIRYNFVDVDYGDGGAIQINNGRVEIKNSDISYNEAGRNGGAVYVYNGDLVMDKETRVLYNVANKEGGAIYVNSKADEVKIQGYFMGNRATEEGGAIYVNSNISGNSGVRISNVEMMGNIASANGGGAVYVDSDDEISLSDKVIMHGNSPDNLHIRHEENIYENNLTAGSRIGIFTSWDATRDDPVETSNHQYFFSDKIGYKIEGGNGILYFVKSSEAAPSSYKVGDTDYDLIKSPFRYTSAEYDEMTSYFYYSDGYFAEEPKYYNEHLASFAAGMAIAAMPVYYVGDYSEERSTKNIVDMFVSMGYSDIFVHYPKPEYFGENAENLSTIGYAIAKKTVVINGAKTTIIAIAVRGGYYDDEWVSNITLGDGFGEAKGFGDAARQVRQGIDQYIANKGINADSATFFITGFSRAGATSNLVAKKLTDDYGEDKVYAYCFEAPKGGVIAEMKDGLTYANIHNVIHGGDIVAAVGPEQMGFIRYGMDHIVPGHEVGTNGYNVQKVLMLAQLAATNKNIKHEDKFAEATMEYIGSTLLGGIFDMIDPEWFPDYDTAEDWIPVFIEKFQEYSMTDMRDKADPDNTDGIFNNKSDDWYGYRNFYSNYKWYVYFDETDGNKVKIKAYVDEPEDFASGKYKVHTLEDAIGNLLLFYYGMPEDRMAELTAVIGKLDTKKIMESLDMTHIWWSVIDDWREYSIDKKNVEFHKIWSVVNKCMTPEEGQKVSTTTLEIELKKVLTDEEYETLLSSLYVLIDFGLDFVAEDYNITDQNLLGTLLYNIGNIMLTHYHDITYSWVRSYDSYYSDIEFVCPHNYGEWSIVKEATTEDYGVQMKNCTHCGESMYEAIPKIGHEDTPPETNEPSENDPSNLSASMFGEGSLAMIVALIALVAAVAALAVNISNKKNGSLIGSGEETDEEESCDEEDFVENTYESDETIEDEEAPIENTSGSDETIEEEDAPVENTSESDETIEEEDAQVENTSESDETIEEEETPKADE